MKKGIDISEWQGNLNYDNFKALKEIGIEFIIIRCGYTSYGKNKEKYKDKYFENNYNLAKQLSIPVGTYYYSCATSEEEAIEEANFILELINNKTFEYPICIDTEDNHDISNPNYSDESQYSIGKDKLTSIIKLICETVEKENKYVSIYASTSWFKNNLIMSDLKDIDKWIAQWSKTVTFKEKYGMWQYSSEGTLKGINGYVDLDYSYKDYPQIMENMGLNGYIKKDTIDNSVKTTNTNNNTDDKTTNTDNNTDDKNTNTDNNTDDKNTNTDNIENINNKSLKQIILEVINKIKKLIKYFINWLKL
jgi:GH25 family lysozyme M1 (1,4-beta-N-acetylmuramidase)